jgi:2,7-dihydroxy-5-methyl-1-naphthoate 7-O-methyltransferase
LSAVSYATASQLERVSSLLNPWAVRAAATLRLPDLVAEGADTTEELARRSGADADALGRLMRHLTILELFSTTTSNRWKLTELGELLRDDHPIQMRRTLDQTNHYVRKVDESTHGLLAAVRACHPAWHKLHGLSFWENMATEPEFGTSYNRLMEHRSDQFGPAITQGYDWSKIQRVVDVGGGTGHIIANILSAHPNLHGTLVDLPCPAAEAVAVLEEADVAARCTIVPQSFFDVLPHDGDVYLLANIIHNWSDKDSVKILRRCAEAAGNGACIVLAEPVMTNKADYIRQAFASRTDLYMLLLIGGRERTEEELRHLGATAGLKHTATYPLVTHPWISLLEYTVEA